MTVVIQVRIEHVDEFRRAVLDNASASLRTEPGCLVFDVCENSDRSEFFLYELYESAEAFDEHLTTAHFNAFDRACAGWIITKRVARYERLQRVTPSHP